MNTGRMLLGVLGKVENLSSIRSAFDGFINKQQLDVSFDYYTTKPEELHERLSEMFHHDRRGYLLAEDLQTAIVPLLDEQRSEKVNVILNDNGTMIGLWLDLPFDEPENVVEKLWEIWTSPGPSSAEEE
jgi:shikimate 5-dehydrogenase